MTLKKSAAFIKFWLIYTRQDWVLNIAWYNVRRLLTVLEFSWQGSLSLICSLGVSLHDVVHLLQLVGQPLLTAELVLLQGQDELLVVLHRVPGIKPPLTLWYRRVRCSNISGSLELKLIYENPCVNQINLCRSIPFCIP